MNQLVKLTACTARISCSQVLMMKQLTWIENIKLCCHLYTLMKGKKLKNIFGRWLENIFRLIRFLFWRLHSHLHDVIFITESAVTALLDALNLLHGLGSALLLCLLACLDDCLWPCLVVVKKIFSGTVVVDWMLEGIDLMEASIEVERKEDLLVMEEGWWNIRLILVLLCLLGQVQGFILHHINPRIPDSTKFWFCVVLRI